MGEIITSLQNYKVKQAVKLREAKGRKETGLMIIEGRKELSLALMGSVKIEHVFYCSDFDVKKQEFQV